MIVRLASGKSAAQEAVVPPGLAPTVVSVVPVHLPAQVVQKPIIVDEPRPPATTMSGESSAPPPRRQLPLVVGLGLAAVIGVVVIIAVTSSSNQTGSVAAVHASGSGSARHPCEALEPQPSPLTGKRLPDLDRVLEGNSLGALTRSWGITMLSETFLLDRGGIVRFYFPNTRAWDTTAARACIQAVARL